MERVYNVRVERFAKHRKVTVPLRAAEKENVVSIDFSNVARQLLVDRFKQRIQRRQPGKMRDRLIQQVITEHGGLVAIVRRQPPPDCDQLLLLLWALVQPGISGAVVDVRARLPSGCGMHIEDHVQTFGAAPDNQLVEQLETFRVVALKETVMQRNANGVESGPMQERDVFARDVVLAVLLPECGRPFRSEQL